MHTPGLSGKNSLPLSMDMDYSMENSLEPAGFTSAPYLSQTAMDFDFHSYLDQSSAQDLERQLEYGMMTE